MEFPLVLPKYSAASPVWSLTARTPDAPPGELIAHLMDESYEGECDHIADIDMDNRRLILAWASESAATAPLWRSEITIVVHILPSRDRVMKLAWQNLLLALHGRGMRLDDKNLHWKADVSTTEALIKANKDAGAGVDLLEFFHQKIAQEHAAVAAKMKEVVDHILAMVNANATLEDGPSRSGRAQKTTTTKDDTNTAKQDGGKKSKAPEAKETSRNVSTQVREMAQRLIVVLPQRIDARSGERTKFAIPEETTAIDDAASRIGHRTGRRNRRAPAAEEDAAMQEDITVQGEFTEPAPRVRRRDRRSNPRAPAAEKDAAKPAPRAGRRNRRAPAAEPEVIDLTADDEVIDLTEEQLIEDLNEEQLIEDLNEEELAELAADGFFDDPPSATQGATNNTVQGTNVDQANDDDLEDEDMDDIGEGASWDFSALKD